MRVQVLQKHTWPMHYHMWFVVIIADKKTRAVEQNVSQARSHCCNLCCSASSISCFYARNHAALLSIALTSTLHPLHRTSPTFNTILSPALSWLSTYATSTTTPVLLPPASLWLALVDLLAPGRELIPSWRPLFAMHRKDDKFLVSMDYTGFSIVGAGVAGSLSGKFLRPLHRIGSADDEPAIALSLIRAGIQCMCCELVCFYC